MEVYVHFIPSSEIQVFTVCLATTIRDLKILWEESCGIPSDVLVFLHNSVLLDDGVVLTDLGSCEYTSLDLLICPAWEKIINCCIKGENCQVIARVKIKTSQLSPESQAFVAAFIAAQKGNSELLQVLIESFKEEVIHRTVCLSGRSLLHAAVLGGNINCVMTLVFNGGWKVLNKADKQREVPLEVAQRMEKGEGLVKILKKYNDIYVDGNWGDVDNTVKHNIEEANGSVDQDEQLGRLYSTDQDNSSVGEQAWRISPDSIVEGSPEGRSRGRGNRSGICPPLSNLAQSESTEPNRKMPQDNVDDRIHRRIKANHDDHLPFVKVKGNRSPLPYPKHTQRETFFDMARRNSLPRNIEKEAILPSASQLQSPSPPTTTRTKHSPKQSARRPRAGSLKEEGRFSMQGNPSYSSSSAPNSPLLLRRRKTLPVSPLAHHEYSSGDRAFLSSSLNKGQPLVFEKARETLPWNVWKNVRTWKTFEDGGSSTISREKNEIVNVKRVSRGSKSFEVWLVDKEREKLDKHIEVETEAKRLAQQKILEESCEKRARSKTFDEWLAEKESNIRKKVEHDITKAEKGARRAQASFKYQEWMNKKDAEALEREEKLRAEEKRKYEELKKKREEQVARWSMKKAD